MSSPNVRCTPADRATVAGVDASDFVEELRQLPAQHLVAARLLAMLEDQETSAAELGRVIATDPALSAQVIRLANSPYYGLRDPVGSADRAAMVVGFDTVRALAAAAAFGLLGERGRVVPEGYWHHSIAAAAGAALVARRVGLASGEAFSAGLLHDIGSALMFRRDPIRYDAVVAAATRGAGLLEEEAAAFGLTHPAVGAQALAAWRFPADFVAAVAAHHGQEPDDGLLARVVVAGEALAVAAAGEPEPPERCEALERALVTVGVEPVTAELLVASVRSEAEKLAGFLVAAA